MRKRILDQPIDIIDINEAAHLVKMAFIRLKQLKIITLNPEMLVNATKNFEFQAAINNSNLVVPDGTGIIWAFKLLNPGSFENVTRVPGIELAEKLLEMANELNKKVAIVGGGKEVLERGVSKLKEKYPDINFVKTIDGYQGKEKDTEIAGEIAKGKPDLLLVALGSPRQEIWINKYASLFPQSVMIGIGGSLDVWSGKVLRAPKWVRDINLEWLFRVVTRPQRTTRILKSLPKFVWMALRARLGTKDQDKMV